MVVRIRLSRFGNRHQPFYNIVVAQARYVLQRSRFAPKFRSRDMTPNSSFPLAVPSELQTACRRGHETFLPILNHNVKGSRLTSPSAIYRSARDSKPLEVIGTYNPVPQIPTGLSEQEAKVAKPFKDIALDSARTKYWLGVGAQPSDPVWRLLSLAGLVIRKSGTSSQTQQRTTKKATQ
ncbi:ribosomal protein S16 [Helicocarpus griseus UAMH5409]|uniref:Ribosomal protein S16 n=1 Tax=Helicocarpus griseus UAMH5409 TaxID=1447875 RepID=A0A2B7XTI3_9EURO|nr:ribosomal protein S16 [Helicocarpus griseus UAMH5409]